ncbi:MAG: HlyD family efflux transporter periplasmic adaptor subunit, partial [Pseudomonadota bacterium]
QRVKGMLLNTQVKSSTSNLLPESALFWAEQEYLEAKLDLLDSTRESAQHTLAILIKRRANIESEVTILVNRLNRIRSGFDSGIFSRIELERIQREVLQLKRVLLELDTEIEVQRGVLEETQLRREELRTERRRESALRQLEIEERITQVNLSIQELKVRIERATIVAATEGKVMVVTVVSQNEVIAPNELIAEIVPTDSALRAEIEISADRVGSLEPGMEARLKVLSYDFTRYGEIVGRIKDISPTSFPNQSGQTVYLVDVEIPGEGLPSGRKVRSGMTVTADILSEQKMILAYLLKPLRALSDRAFTEA